MIYVQPLSRKDGVANLFHLCSSGSNVGDIDTCSSKSYDMRKRRQKLTSVVGHQLIT